MINLVAYLICLVTWKTKNKNKKLKYKRLPIGFEFSLGFVEDLWFDDFLWGFLRICGLEFMDFGLMLDDLDVLLLIWLGFDLLVLEICLG